MQPNEPPNPPEDIRRPVRAKRKGGRRIFLLLVIAALLASAYVYREEIAGWKLVTLAGEKLAALRGATAPAKTGDVYICPMHPNYHSDKPGTCPICGMNLVKMDPEDMVENE